MSEAVRLVKSLLYDDVIDCTIGVMTGLQRELTEMVRKGVRPSPELTELLLKLGSESIREALHKGELHITNAIIRAKNQLLSRVGAEIPEGHQEIDPEKYRGYNW
jgi:hypothetical protein